MQRTRSGTIRASEIGSYLFCKRAWWYQRGGEESKNTGEMVTGTELHEAHGRAVLSAGLYRLIGYLMLLTALVLLVYFLLTSLV
jgi:CRISPR/Cas system-associated exonuclease Cas4 (RecB family)